MLVRERELTLGGASLREAGAVVAAFIHRIKSLLITPFADQGNILLERTLVSHVGVGSVASMEYARTLTDTALFLVSQPIGFVMLAQTTGDRETTGHRVELLLRPLLALSLPAALFMMIFATDIVTVVLRRGAFQEHAVTLTSAALGGISAGLWAAVIGSVFIRMLNAAHRNRMAAVILLVGAAGQALVNVLAVRDLGVLGAGLGDSTRGLVMLIGAAWALHSGRLLLRLLMLMVIPAVLFVAMGEGIRAVVVSPFTRLILGGGSFGVGILLCLLMLAPEFCRMVMQRLRVRRLRAQT
jgi:putative peptidoglycan lipid II flippase